MVSHNGTKAGHEARKLQEFSYPLPSRWTLIMHSDGINTQVGTWIDIPVWSICILRLSRASYTGTVRASGTMLAWWSSRI